MEWNTRNASPARKSRDERSPATGRNVNPVQSATDGECYKLSVLLCCVVLCYIVLYCMMTIEILTVPVWNYSFH